jgi:primosomal protein N' (replication factor Y) (superfamily II helicase)
MSRAADVWRVVLDAPLRRPFDYLPPKANSVTTLTPGVRVRVPFGAQRLIGIATQAASESAVAPERLKSILDVLDSAPVLDKSLRTLLQWAADYYHHPVGEVFTAALPKALRVGAAALARPQRWIVSPAGRAAAASGEPRRAPQQRRVLAELAPHDTGIDAEELPELIPGATAPLRALARRGWVELIDAPLAIPASFSTAPLAGGFELNGEQASAVEAVSTSWGRFGAFVLHGVTGSGKTEVYLQLVARVLAAGGSALILVPEIGLTPQLIGRFRARFAAPIAVLHSGLGDRERLQAWRAAFTGEARIVLGTRSAVFAPLATLALIVVDEEHDPSFKQHEGGFHYSARDLAVVRAQQSGVPVVLGSATPAFETLHNVSAGRYQRLSLPRRTGQALAPRLGLIDLRVHAVHCGIAAPAIEAIERHLGADGQVLVFLNRRGYAPTLLCTACGWTAACRECDARMTVHQAAARLRCHHCGADEPLLERCPQCGFAVRAVGQGTERIEEKLAELFPGVAHVRLDRDAVRRKGDVEAAVRRMASGEARILIGTQMVTKGHDFPNVTLVVVLNADRGLFSTDFRAPERLAQTIVQVAGRAGRGERPGEVLIQTEFPDHPLLQSLLAEGYDGFARTALIERKRAAWPPYSRLAAVRASAKSAEAALQFLTDARRSAHAPARVRLLGPVPAAMAKRAGRYHAQLLLESRDRGALQRFLADWIEKIEALPSARRVRWALDVDPLELF